MRRAVLGLILASLVMPAAAQDARKTPYWASIASGEAMMRTGPGRNYPATWLYRRADLPIQVFEVYPSWRKVRDPGGTEGWMLVNLLSDTRTALVVGAEAVAMHQLASARAPVAFRVEPGVVGRISKCGGGWCRFEVGGRAGFIGKTHLWGVGAEERID